MLRTNHLPVADLQFDEGSGLSRNNLTTANVTVGLLKVMATHRGGVASAILADVEPGFQPGGKGVGDPVRAESSCVDSGGKMPPSTAGRRPGAILDGRDIGTVICPDAEVKIFVTATSEERARRRWLEMSRSGDPISFEDVLADIHRRDARDSGRSTAPLRIAEDARLLDTTKLDIEAAFGVAVGIVEERLSGRATR